MLLPRCLVLRSTFGVIRVELQYLPSSLGAGCVLLCTLVLSSLAVVRVHGEFQLGEHCLLRPHSSWSLLNHHPLVLHGLALLFHETSLDLPCGGLTGLQGSRAGNEALPCSRSVTIPL